MNYLHVGFPKCASTFLRDHYFTRQNDFYNLGHHGTHEWRRFIQHQLLNEQSSVYKGRIPDLSLDPDLTVETIKKTYFGLSSPEVLGTSKVDFSLILKRWKTIFPNSHILIVIRAQHRLLYSYYTQLVRGGYFQTPEEYLKSIRWDAQQSLWGRMYFDRIVELAQAEFEHVKVIPYEYTLNFNHFIAELNNFFGTNASSVNQVVRASPGDRQIHIMRLLNRVFRHGVGLPTDVMKPGYVVGYGRNLANQIDLAELPTKRRELIRIWSYKLAKFLRKDNSAREDFYQYAYPICSKYFGESNYRLERVSDINLKQFGYPGH